MKDEHENIKKQSYISLFFSYCIYVYDIRLMHLLIDEITQLGIITVYIHARRVLFLIATYKGKNDLPMYWTPREGGRMKLIIEIISALRRRA